MNKKNIYDIIAVVSTLGILCWVITDFWGGMLIYLLTMWMIIVPLIILYIVSFIDTLISTIKTGFVKNKVKVLSHGFVILAILSVNLFQSDLFKSKRVLVATLKDDLSLHTLVFRENGKCENEVSGIFGVHEVYHGQYKFSGDTIIFQKKPYENDFIPDTLLIDENLKAIFMEKDTQGHFNKTKGFLNHFNIQ
jgi:hypothetical protein